MDNSFKAKLRKMGNSQGILIPKKVITILGVKLGDFLEIEKEKGVFVITNAIPSEMITPKGKKFHYRQIAEKKYGRKLKLGEIVHYIDGNHNNDNPDNLYILPSNKSHLIYEQNLRNTYYKWIKSENNVITSSYNSRKFHKEKVITSHLSIAEIFAKRKKS